MAEEQTIEESIRPPFIIEEEEILQEPDPYYQTPEGEQPLPETPSIPYEVENNIIKPSSAEEEYLGNKESRNAYESSPAILEDTEQEYNDERNGPLQAAEEDKIKKRDPSGWVNTADDMIMSSAAGVKRMVSETGETLGAPEG